MPAKAKKPPAASKSTPNDTATSTSLTSSSAKSTLPSSNWPIATRKQQPHERLISVASSIAPGDLDQRPNPTYQGTAPGRQIQQSPNLSNPPNQPPYGVQGVFSPHNNIQSPYLSNPSQFQPQQQQPNESAYYPSHPSPRSTTSTAYYQSDKPDSMAATATMQRPPYPPIYHTPQSNSPASVTSPQTHDHGRPMFAPPQPQLSQPMYPYGYQPLSQMHQPPYGSHSQSPMTAQPMLPNQYNPGQMPHGQPSAHPPGLNASPQMKQESHQQYSQTPQNRPSLMAQQQQTPNQTPGSASLAQGPNGPPGTGSNAAPGPIPATTPLVVRQDNNGVQWIAFEYSRDRVKSEYTIRCDVESVDTTQLSQEFKGENCVYPRACVPKEQYKGNRLNYESDCNQVGWALAELNPCLRSKRGLIQRAVDSWRNSNQDVRLRSRRVRRQAKITNKSRISNSNAGPPPTPGSAGPVSAGLPGSNSLAGLGARPPGQLPSNSQQIHHHHQQEMSPNGPDPSGAANFSASHSLHRPGSTHQHMGSPNDLRHAQTFPGYQPYAAVPTTLGPSMAPPIQGGMHHFGRPGGNATMVSQGKRARDEDDSALFGDVPEGKRRKFILVDDTQKNARVRVKVTLNQIEMSEIPDSYRKNNAVYPRSWYPVQMQSASEPTTSNRFADEDAEDHDDGPPTVGRISVPCAMTDEDGEVDVPQLTKAKQSRERKINELGYRMAWGQSRVFSNRPVFLSRALDAYRIKQHTALTSSGQEVSSIPAHLETRPGKRRWLQRARHTTHPSSPTQTTNER